MRHPRALLLPLLLLLACSAAPAEGPTSRPAGGGEDVAQEELLRRVAAIHGGAGPFAVAGYRMAEAALKQLGLAPGRFDILVVHRSPAQVQWSCVADGLQAASGTSVGKLNLRWEETDGVVESRIGTRDGSRVLVCRLRPSFLERYLDTPRERLMAAGREVAGLPHGELFTLEPLAPPGEPGQPGEPGEGGAAEDR